MAKTKRYVTDKIITISREDFRAFVRGHDPCHGGLRALDRTKGQTAEEMYNEIRVPDYIGWFVSRLDPRLYYETVNKLGYMMIYNRKSKKALCDRFRKLVPFSKLVPLMTRVAA